MAHDWNEFDIIINQATPIGKKSLTEGQVCEPLGAPLYPGDNGDGVLRDAIKAVFDIEKSLIFDREKLEEYVNSHRANIEKSEEYKTSSSDAANEAQRIIDEATALIAKESNSSLSRYLKSCITAFAKRYERLNMHKLFVDTSHFNTYLEAVCQLASDAKANKKCTKAQLKEIKKCLIDLDQVNRILRKRLKEDDIITKKILDQHSHEDQVRGAVEVAKLVGVEPEEGEIKYEITRENMVAQMRQNKTYQFCMLLAGFTGEKMDKYWITPSEVNQGGQKRKHEEINEEQREKVKRKVYKVFDTANKIYEEAGTIPQVVIQSFGRKMMFISNILRGTGLNYIQEAAKEYIDDVESVPDGEKAFNEKVDKIKEYAENIKDLTIVEFPELNMSAPTTKKTTTRGRSNTGSGSAGDLKATLAANEKTRASTGASSELNSEFHNWYVNTSWADGRIHLSPTLYAHIEEAYTVLRMRWKHLKEVDLSYFIESPTVRAYFARLVGFCIRTSDTLSGKRYHLQANYRRVNFEKAKLSNIFRHVHFRGRQLVYDRSDDSGRYVPGTKDWSNKEYLDTKATVQSRELSLDKHGYPQNQAVIATFLAEKAKEAQILNALRN
mgnify:CR=1 FL=1